MGQRGQAFVEYFVLALIVMLASLAFFRSQAKFQNSGVGVRAKVETAFTSLCQGILGKSC